MNCLCEAYVTNEAYAFISSPAEAAVEDDSGSSPVGDGQEHLGPCRSTHIAVSPHSGRASLSGTLGMGKTLGPCRPTQIAVSRHYEHRFPVHWRWAKL